MIPADNCPTPVGHSGGVNPAARLVLRVMRDPKFRALLISLGPAAAKAAGDLAKQGRWRQLAVVHADAVVDGSLMKVPIAAVPHWVVWSGDNPVAAYPPPTGDLVEAVRDVDLTKRQRPEDLGLRGFRAETRRRLGRG
jgi:hypothetical protein